MFKNKKILFIGAHQDDLEIACGGTILNYQKYSEIHYLIVTDSIIKNKKVIRNKRSVKKNFTEIKKKLDIKSFTNLNFKCNKLIFNDDLVVNILRVIEKIEPDIIFTHWPNDIHQDHSAVGKSSISAGRHVKNILFYRSNFYQPTTPFNKNLFINISKNFKKKFNIIKIYKDELKRHSYKWLNQIENLNSFDGKLINADYAESFEINKISID